MLLLQTICLFFYYLELSNCNQFTTSFFDGNAQSDGIMFNIDTISTSEIRITGLSINCIAGTKTVLVYRKSLPGSYTTSIYTQTDWYLEISRQVTCNDNNIATNIGGLSLKINANSTQAFFIYIPNGLRHVKYSNTGAQTTEDDGVIRINAGEYTSGGDIFVFSGGVSGPRYPNIVIQYQLVNTYMQPTNSYTAAIKNEGIMFDITTKSNKIRIKTLHLGCHQNGATNIRVYRRKTFTTYSTAMSDPNQWLKIYDTTLTCVTQAWFNIGSFITNDIFIPEYTTLGIYVYVANELNYLRDGATDAENNDMRVSVGTSISGLFGSQTANRQFTSRIYYEVVNCYLSQSINTQGIYSLNVMTTDNDNIEYIGDNSIESLIDGTTVYLCYNIISPYVCYNPSITVSLLDNDYVNNNKLFDLSIVSGLTSNSVELNKCVINNDDNGIQCNGNYLTCGQQSINNGDIIYQSNGELIIAVSVNSEVNQRCSTLNKRQILNADISLNCELTPSPTKYPTIFPTKNPSINPTLIPTKNPSLIPTKIPTNNPTFNPTQIPTIFPTNNPTKLPTNLPSINPTLNTLNPTNIPTILTINPTYLPTINTISPTLYPTLIPSLNPTLIPTMIPSVPPTFQTTKNIIKSKFFPFIAQKNELLLFGVIAVALVYCCCFILVICFFSSKTRKHKNELKQIRTELTQVKSMSNISINDINQSGLGTGSFGPDTIPAHGTSMLGTNSKQLFLTDSTTNNSNPDTYDEGGLNILNSSPNNTNITPFNGAHNPSGSLPKLPMKRINLYKNESIDDENENNHQTAGYQHETEHENEDDIQLDSDLDDDPDDDLYDTGKHHTTIG